MSLSPSRFPTGFAAESGSTCTIWWIRQALGRTDCSDARFVAYAQELVDGCGFPPPFPSKLKGQPLTRAVTAHSSFRRDAVQAWLDDYLPPACAARLDGEAMHAAAAALDARAANLGQLTLINGGRP